MFGIKTLKKKLGKTKESIHEGYETRKNFSKNIFKNISEIFKDAKTRELVRKEIPISQAIEAWGFGLGEMGYRRARKATGFMWVFFLIIFLWCTFYFMRSLVFTENYMAAIGSLFGMITGFCVTIINLWRWMILKHRKYVPFFTWVKSGGALN